MNKTLKWVIIGLVAVIAVLIGLSKAGVIGKEEGTRVAAEKAEIRNITETVNASGKVYPEVEITLAPDISGEIVMLNVEEGDSVVKGQVLAQIYGDIYATQRDQASAIVNQQEAMVANAKANLLAAQAQMEQAEKTYKMQKQLFDDKVISLNEFNNALAAYQTAQANYKAAQQSVSSSIAGVASAKAGLEKANKDIGRATLTAPMSGIVSLLNVKEGERVVGSSMMAGTEMMRIADMSKIEVRVDVGENDIPKVHLGDTALIEIDAYNDRKFKGVVTQIASSNNGAAAAGIGSANANTSSDVANYKVYIRLDPASYSDLIDPEHKRRFPFRPGMNASADIQTQTRTNVVSVPINAVTTREKPDSLKSSGSFDDSDLDVVVFVVDSAKGTVSKKLVKTGIQDINYIEIVSGINQGDKVVSDPYDVISKSLQDGDKVNVVPKNQLFLTDKKD
ncbi:MAG: efflux RND transporter periplasmic adaptor subunit [Chitinophagaceae bacterium]|nr:efflux RND transporter periplasmic adaptor subunit [Chitinophagaceae bacterium]